MEDLKWIEEAKERMKNILSNAIEENLTGIPKIPTDKGSIRNLNNHRMKYWCDCFFYYKNQNASRESAGYNADLCLEEFDKRFFYTEK